MAALHTTSEILFLDIETTGLSRYYDEITIVGWLYRGSYHVYVAGDDPTPLLDSLGKASTLVTFNGTLFDIPFLRNTFPDISVPAMHADLRYIAKRVGLTGGQKAIEKELGITIRQDLEEIDGAEAVLLWHRYLRGDMEALRRLIEYNRCDVLGMRHLLDEALHRLIIAPDFWFAPSRFASQPAIRKGWADKKTFLPCPSRLNRPQNTFTSLFKNTPAENAIIVGIDLTGSEARPSGWCILHGTQANTTRISSDEEIIEQIITISPTLVSIDSPLSIPFGRTRISDDDPERERFGIMRKCERELKRRGINVYPCLLPSMQGLTRRGIRLATRLRHLGIPVIESYPGAAQDIMGIPRKGAGETFLKQGLSDFGIIGPFTHSSVTHDELDAITSALVGSFFLAGQYEALSGPNEDPLIIPDLKAKHTSLVVGISGAIAAGKTTTARLLEQMGFAYTRFSLVIDDEIIAQGLTPDRSLRQQMGFEIHQQKGQRWLAGRALERVGEQAFIVVDGLRFLEDHSFFIERYGSRFVHLHIIAPPEIRSERYRHDNLAGFPFEIADRAEVETEVPQLEQKADACIHNTTTIDALALAIKRDILHSIKKKGYECPSLLS